MSKDHLSNEILFGLQCHRTALQTGMPNEKFIFFLKFIFLGPDQTRLFIFYSYEVLYSLFLPVDRDSGNDFRFPDNASYDGRLVG